MTGRDRYDDDSEEFGEASDADVAIPEVAIDVEAEEAVEAEVAVKESEPTGEGYDPYYDEPTPKGVGGSFVLRDGKRYRVRPNR